MKKCLELYLIVNKLRGRIRTLNDADTAPPYCHFERSEAESRNPTPQ